MRMMRSVEENIESKEIVRVCSVPWWNDEQRVKYDNDIGKFSGLFSWNEEKNEKSEKKIQGKTCISI